MASEPGRSVRELGGELQAELARHLPQEELDWELRHRIVDLVMGVLARHVGEVIQADEGLEVPPLAPVPRR